ncbi:MAG: OmpA family protein, partial [Betaproteobacteria bacterium]
AQAAAPSPPPPPPIMPFNEAVQFAANNLFGKAELPASPSGKYQVVIDPLVDGNSGVQSNATQTMEARVTDLLKTGYPKYELLPFTPSSLVRGPLLFIGTFTAVDKDGRNDGVREWYRVCLALVDLRTGLIVSKGFARASLQDVDHTPTAFFLDSPAWAPDPATQGYVRTCQGTKVGDPINPMYIDRVYAAAQIRDAVSAYTAGRYEEALDLYRAVLRSGAGDQLRVHNGMYLANKQLGRRNEAAVAFSRLVEYGFAQKRLGVKFLFRPASSVFAGDTAANAEYMMMLKQISTAAATGAKCVEVSGHTSRTGSEPINDRLSFSRADYVQKILIRDAPKLRPKATAVGKGWKENISGLGTDDNRDALDRRVEFKVEGSC